PSGCTAVAFVVASIGAAMLAGLYPFIPWRFHAQLGGPALERLRGVITMPAGVAASRLLLRFLGTTRGDLTTIPLPGIPVEWRLFAAGLAFVPVAVTAVRDRRLPVSGTIVAAVLAALLVAYPTLHWAHLVLIAAGLSVLYA